MNANNIENFMSKRQPKYKLRKYSDEIIFLIGEGYTQADVLFYLKEYYELKVSRQTLSNHLQYLKKNSKRVVKTPKSIQSNISESDKKKALERVKRIGGEEVK